MSQSPPGQPSCRQAFDKITPWLGSHAGLLLACHYRGRRNEKGDPEARAAILQAAQRALERTRPLYSMTFERWERATAVSATRSILGFRTTGRVLCGLGNKGVLEAGIRLHHTYGVPFLPGSSLKGICAHYCDEVWGKGDEGARFKNGGDTHQLLFGVQEQAGYLHIQDGWLLPADCSGARGGLLRDVITPHHPGYYRTGDKEKPATPPLPSDNPIPIGFLSVAGTFRIALEVDSGDSAESRDLLALGSALLQQALTNWGVGAKTSSGYGRMTLVNQP